MSITKYSKYKITYEKKILKIKIRNLKPYFYNIMKTENTTAL